MPKTSTPSSNSDVPSFFSGIYEMASSLQHLNAAQGFLELGMYEDANAELEEIDPFCETLPEVLEVRLNVYSQTARWELMETVANFPRQSARRFRVNIPT
jgi:hypothetical protein